MNAQIVSYHCVLKNIVGQIINTTYSNEVITSVLNPQASELPAFARAMKNLHAGEKRRVVLSAAEAYGIYDPDLVKDHPRENFASDLFLGDRVHMAGPKGNFLAYRVTYLSKYRVILDANHPLAGQDLVFDIDVLAAREATHQELLEASQTGECQQYLH